MQKDPVTAEDDLGLGSSASLPFLISIAPSWLLGFLSEFFHHISRLVPANSESVADALALLLAIDTPKAQHYVSTYPLLSGLRPLLLAINLRLLSLHCSISLHTAAAMATLCPLLLATRPRALQVRLNVAAKILCAQPDSEQVTALLQSLPCMLLICPKTMALRCANLAASLRVPNNRVLDILRAEPRLLLLAVSVVRDKVKWMSNELGSCYSAAAVFKKVPGLLLLDINVLQKRLAVLKDAFQLRLEKSLLRRPQVLSVQGSQLRARIGAMRSMAGARGMAILGPNHMMVLQQPAGNTRKNFNGLEEVFGSAAGELVVREPLLLLFERSRLKALLDTLVIHLAIPWTRLLAIIRHNPRILLHKPAHSRQLLESFARRVGMRYSVVAQLAEHIPGLLYARKEQPLSPNEVARILVVKRRKLVQMAATNPGWRRQLSRTRSSTLVAMLLVDSLELERLEFVAEQQQQEAMRMDSALLMSSREFARKFPHFPQWRDMRRVVGIRMAAVRFKAGVSALFLAMLGSGACSSAGSARLLLPPLERGDEQQTVVEFEELAVDRRRGEDGEEGVQQV